MEIIKVDSTLMELIKDISIFIGAISVIYHMLNEPEFENFINIIFGLFKFIGYGALAMLIYSIGSKNDTIDVMSFFTYVLACFEAAHIFSIVMAKVIAGIIKGVFILIIEIFKTSY